MKTDSTLFQTRTVRSLALVLLIPGASSKNMSAVWSKALRQAFLDVSQ